ncbi:MAG: hypothetical protein ABJB12_22555 [Pseudomonadota bacterium]
MSELGAARTDSGPPPPASPVPNALRALRERASTVLPGLYAWLTTVALPSAQQRASGATRVTALLALVSLLAAPLFVSQRPVLARCLGIFSFLGCSLLTWVLLGAGLLQNPNDPLLSALGAVAFTLYALGWGSLRRRGAVPEDGPNVIPGPPLQPRGKPQRGTPIVFGVIVACAFVPIFLAFRVAEPERALFAHAAAILAAILTITVGARVAMSVGQRKGLPPAGERLNSAAVPLALLALVFALGFLWLVVR